MAAEYRFDMDDAGRPKGSLEVSFPGSRFFIEPAIEGKGRNEKRGFRVYFLGVGWKFEQRNPRKKFNGIHEFFVHREEEEGFDRT